MKKLKDLPREYFYEIENTTTKNASPKASLLFLFLSLFFSVTGAFFFNSIEEPTFSFYLSIIFVVFEAPLIVLMLILMINNMWQRLKKFYLVLELLSFIIFTYSSIPLVISLFTTEYLPVYIILSPLLLFPLSFAFQCFLINIYKKAVFDGKFLHGGEGFFTKSTMRKYGPPLAIATAFIEGSSLTLIIWLRLTMRILGNIVGLVTLPFLSLILVLTFSIVTAIYFLEVYFTFSFADWGAVSNKNTKKDNKK